MSILLTLRILLGLLDFWKISGPMVYMLACCFFGHRLFLQRVQGSPFMNCECEDQQYLVRLIHHYCGPERTTVMLNAFVSKFFQLHCPVIM